MAGSPDFPAVTMKDSRESRLKESAGDVVWTSGGSYNEGF